MHGRGLWGLANMHKGQKKQLGGVFHLECVQTARFFSGAKANPVSSLHSGLS